jgi:hypothetical protein
MKIRMANALTKPIITAFGIIFITLATLNIPMELKQAQQLFLIRCHHVYFRTIVVYLFAYYSPSQKSLFSIITPIILKWNHFGKVEE